MIPNGFDTDVFVPSDNARASVRAELGVPENTVLVGRIGRYHHTKDYPNFLQAAAMLLRNHPDIQFLVAGKNVDWNNGELRRQVQEFGLVERIHLLGERFDIPRLTAALDIAVSSSHAEGFPNVVGEAMACAVPCVVTDVGDSSWLVGDTAAMRHRGGALQRFDPIRSRTTKGTWTGGARPNNRALFDLVGGAIVRINVSADH